MLDFSTITPARTGDDGGGNSDFRQLAPASSTTHDNVDDDDDDDDVVVLDGPPVGTLGLHPLPPQPEFRVTPPLPRTRFPAHPDPSRRLDEYLDPTTNRARSAKAPPAALSVANTTTSSTVKLRINTDSVIRYKGKMIATMTETEVAEHLRTLGVKPIGSHTNMQDLLARAAKVPTLSSPLLIRFLTGTARGDGPGGRHGATQGTPGSALFPPARSLRPAPSPSGVSRGPARGPQLSAPNPRASYKA